MAGEQHELGDEEVEQAQEPKHEDGSQDRVMEERVGHFRRDLRDQPEVEEGPGEAKGQSEELVVLCHDEGLLQEHGK